MTSGKILNALRCVEEGQKCHVLSLSDKVDNKTVNQTVERHPAPADMKENYLVVNPFEHTLPFHPQSLTNLTPEQFEMPP